MTTVNVKYQRLLKDLNFYDGAIDGLSGPKTTAAVKKFQKYVGIVADGKLNVATQLKLDEQLTRIPDRVTPTPVRPIHPDSVYKRWPRETTDELTAFYGPVGTNQVMFEPPYPMVLAWEPKKAIKKFSCHKLVAESLYKILEDVKVIYKPEKIKEYGFDKFGGCLNVRTIRGGNRWSTHAWGIAIDIDPARNGLKTPWNQAFLGRPECDDFVAAFKAQGWYSLGHEKNYDAMHFQACYR